MTTPIFNRYSWLACVCGMLATSISYSAPGEIAGTPLFTATSTSGGIPANIFFQIDDSGSMDWAIINNKYFTACNYDPQNPGLLAGKTCTPTTLQVNGEFNTYNTLTNCSGNSPPNFCGVSDINQFVTGSGTSANNITTDMLYDWRIRASAMNAMYYNPDITYEPWKTGDGTRCSPASFTAAKNFPTPYDCGAAATQTTVGVTNLTGFLFEIAHDTHGYAGSKPSLTTGGSSISTKVGTVITTTVDQGINRTEGANGLVDFWDEHTAYQVNASSIAQTEVIYTPTKTSPTSTTTTSGNKVTITKKYTQNLNPTLTATTLTTGLNGRTLDAEKQNIANWYQYYRQRINVAKASVAEVIDSNPKYRYGFSTIWNKDFVEVPASTVDTTAEYITHNKALLAKLFARPPGSSTPLPNALNRVGQYFMHKALPSIGSTTGTGVTYANPIIYDCQQNFGILQTDGYWNADLNSTDQTLIGDKDGDGVGATHSTVADVARYYYITDLDGDSTNNKVPTSAFDTNAKQHMVTYTVAFGLEGNLIKGPDGWPTPPLTESGDNKNTLAIETGLWGTAVNGGTTVNIDDLWHAAYNAKGLYVSASSPEAIAAGFANIFENIAQRNFKGSATSASFNVSKVSGGNSAYVSQFGLVSNVWSGDLLKFEFLQQLDANGDPVIDPVTNQPIVSGELSTTPTWSAAEKLDAKTHARHIFTYNPSAKKGVPFEWSALSDFTTVTTPIVSTAQKDLGTNTSGNIPALTITATDAINATAIARLDYLRGDQTNEGTGYDFRVRTYTDTASPPVTHNNLLGDIIHSDPVLVSSPDRNWPARSPFPTSAASYRNFKAANSSRTPIVYVGANDGMLHGFNANTGEEAIAYIPDILFSYSTADSGLHYLTNPQYIGQNHRYYVDAPPVVEDVYIDTQTVGVASGARWHTVLVGGLMGGGRGIYALDITNPNVFETEDAANAAKIALWEFNSTHDADMGYSFSVPSIVMMNNGRWAAVFGNGYNNTGSGKAALFIVFLDGGVDGVWTDGIAVPGSPQDYIKITATTPIANPNGADVITNNDCMHLATTTPTVTAASNCNGLSTPQTVDLNADSVIDRIYAGDLKGNMWAFDVSSVAPTGWKVAYGTSTVPAPLFTASHHITPYNTATPKVATGLPVQQTLCAGGTVCRQAITSRPTVIQNRKSLGYHQADMLVFFGTGQYLNLDDTSNNDMQSFYGVWDHGVGSLTPATPTTGSATTPSFVEQTFETGFTDINGNAISNIRVLTQYPVAYNTTTSSKNGWFINLSNQANSGERQIVNTDILDDKYLFFNTWIPGDKTSVATNSCDVAGNVSGSGYLMSVDLFTGGSANVALFDLNGVGGLTDADKVKIANKALAPAGRSYDTGLPGSSSFVKGKQYTPGTDAGTNLGDTKVYTPPADPFQRQSWQELRNE